MRSYKLRINGESPRSILLAYILAKLQCEVFIDDSLIDLNTYKDYQIISYTNFLKNLLNKFDIWNEFEDISYGVTSICVYENYNSKKLLFRAENSFEKYLNTFGWTANYSDIKTLLIDKLINFENVHFISKNKLLDDNLSYDYEFNFNNYVKFSNLCKFPLSIFQRKDKKVFIFNVYLRGNVEKRLYEIQTTEGLFVLTPLGKNLYQIIWNNTSNKIKATSLISKSLLLDHVTTLLPAELKVDQIIGKINTLYINNVVSIFQINNKSICFNENILKSNILFDFNFEFLIRNILQIYNFYENNVFANNKIFNKLKNYYLLKKYIEFIINVAIHNSIINLIITNNIIIIYFRKFLFALLSRVNSLKIIIINKLCNSNTTNIIL